MTLTFEVTLEEARRVETAQARGVDVNALVRGLIAALPLEPSAPPIKQTREDLEAMFDALAEGGENLPVLPPEAYDRENLYGERF